MLLSTLGIGRFITTVCVCIFCVCVCVCVLRYGKEHPHFFVGSLENAMKEVVSNIEDPDQVSIYGFTALTIC